MNVEPDALTPEEQTNEVVINKPKEGTSGRS